MLHVNDEGPQDEVTSVRDGDRQLQFHGTLIGSSSSWKDGKSRWAEIVIYRTTSGKYIVAGIGRSIVSGEDDKHWAQVCDRPEGVIEKLHMLDGDQSKYMPYVNKKALDEAKVNDQGLAEAYLIEVVD